ncbi:hypothetical protein PMZ80_003912 [Knufia obscura]|uniref:Uncharacterized protein n=1 Tax=Knufia obscura TaxID=1635080 RepID=A0ABR0RWK2_9EURO|nr:hypothetical protein PMZ80_003912 [Knufia obscura]
MSPPSQNTRASSSKEPLAMVKSLEHIPLSSTAPSKENSLHRSEFLSSKEFDRIWEWIPPPPPGRWR